MNKGIIFSLAMLLSLPGCMGRKKPKEKNKMQQTAMNRGVDVFSSVDIPLAQDMPNEQEETHVALNNSDEVRSFFDEEIGEFESEEDLSLAMNEEEGVEARETQALEKFAWVDAATKEGDEEFKAIYFRWDSDDVRTEEKESIFYDIGQTKEELKVAQKTGINPTVVIEGHACHAAGSPAYNLALSEKRAKKIADRFVDAGIDRTNIKIVGRGQDVPAIVNGEKITGSREEQWPNRRVEVRVIYS